MVQVFPTLGVDTQVIERIDRTVARYLLPHIGRRLADAYYQRQTVLIEHGFVAFQSWQHYIEAICGETAYQLEQTLMIEGLKSKFLCGEHEFEWFREKYNASSSRARVLLDRLNADHGAAEHIYQEVKSDQTLLFEDRRVMLYRVKPDLMKQIEQSREEEFQRLQKQELLCFTKAENSQHTEYNADYPVIYMQGKSYSRQPKENAPKYLSLYKQVMNEDAGKLGFEYDKSLSTRAKPIYSKPLREPWKIAFTIDKRNFVDKYFPSLIMNFGLLHQDNRGAEWGYQHFCIGGFQEYFPIGNTYLSFLSLDELEVNIRAHVYMYSVIQRDYETGLSAGLEDAETALTKLSP